MTIQLQGVLSLCNHMHQTMQRLVEERQYRVHGFTPNDREYLALFKHLQTGARQIETLCHNEHLTPSALPAPSQRAYAWLRFLSQGNPETNWALPQHLETLALALRTAQDAAPRPAHHILPMPSPPINFSITYQASLYRAQIQKHSIVITLHEGYIGAPENVIQSLVQSLFKRRRKTTAAAAKAYAAGEEFTEITLALASICDPNPLSAVGRVFQLEDVFERVNRHYFKGKILKPHLTWSKILTRRKMGHYQPSTDTVLISLTLDTPRTPEYFIDFIMYHELLHKHLGMKVVGGRRYAHTRAFRTAERRFAQYEEAQKILHHFPHTLP
jgi:hypothetical protein